MCVVPFLIERWNSDLWLANENDVEAWDQDLFHRYLPSWPTEQRAIRVQLYQRIVIDHWGEAKLIDRSGNSQYKQVTLCSRSTTYLWKNNKNNNLRNLHRKERKEHPWTDKEWKKDWPHHRTILISGFNKEICQVLLIIVLILPKKLKKEFVKEFPN